MQLVTPQTGGGDRRDPASRPTAEEAAAKRVSLRPLLGLRPYLLRHRGMLAAAFAALVISAAATLAVPLAVRRMIDLGFSGIDPDLIDKYFITLAGIGLILALASAARFYAVNWLGERVVADIRRDVFKHLTGLSPAFYEVSHSGEVMSRLTADTTQVKGAASTVISQALRNVLLLAGAAVMMVVTSPKLSLAVLIAIPVIMLPLVAYGRSVRTLSRQAQDTLAQASAYASESLTQVRVMQAFTHEDAAAKRFGAAVDRSFEAANARAKARAGLTAIAIFLVFASVVGVLWYGAQDVLSGLMTGGRLSQFVLYAVLAATAVGGLSETWGEIAQCMGAAERLSELLQVQSQIVSPLAPKPLPKPARGEIAFRDVTFAYPLRPETSALERLSFSVSPGERVALVGPSGAGKTTIFALLLRFYDANRGKVEVDGVPVNEADLAELRRRFALVPQETRVVRRYGRRQYRLRQGRGQPERDRDGRQGRLRPRLHRASAAGLRHHAGRGRRDAVGRAAAADRHCPGGVARRVDFAAGRGDQRARCGKRDFGAEGARQDHARPHDAGDRTPTGNRRSAPTVSSCSIMDVWSRRERIKA